MAIVMRMEVPATTAQYERANEIMGIANDGDAPDGLVLHVAGSTGETILVIDVWESEEKLNRFFEERLGAALHEVGLAGSAPEIMPVHAMIPKGSGTHAGTIMETRVDRGPEVYDELVKRMDVHADGGSTHPASAHVCGVTGAGTLYIADVWDSPESFGAFAEGTLGPIAGESLGEIQPRFVPVINMMRGRAAVGA